MSSEQSGRCLCGSVRFRATPKKPVMGVCHCGMCRRWSGGTMMAVECEAPVTFDSDETLGVYVSSDWGERLFCAKCGSSLMWRTRDGTHVSVSAHALEDSGQFRLAYEIFVDEKPANYAFANETKKMTGAEVFEMVTAGKEL